MITEGLMRAGGWTLRFDPDSTPYGIRRRMTYFSNIIVTASHIGEKPSFEDLKGVSLYSGILTRRALRRGEISGLGLLGYIATGKGSAGIWRSGYESVPLPATFGDVLDHWFDSATEYGNGLRIGTAYSPTSNTVDSLASGTLPDMKKALDDIAAATSNAYRVTPAGLVDYGTTLFDARQILVSPDVKPGAGGGWQLWEPHDWDPESDVEDYRNTGRVLIQDKSNSASQSVTWGIPGIVPEMRTWNNSYASTAVWTNTERAVESSSMADALAIATAVANNRARPNFSVSCKVRVPAITRHVIPGDGIYVLDGLEGIVGTTHVPIPGIEAPPLLQQVQSIVWPVEEGMGVYLVDGAFLTTPDVPSVTDISPYVQWETNQPASLELGTPARLGGTSNLTD